MTTSRRNFLRNGAIGALAAGVSLGVSKEGFAASAGSEFPELPDMAAFQAQLKTDFLIGRSKVPIRLVDVLKLGSKRAVGGKREAFTLTFRADPKPPLKQETYTIEHARLGTFSMLLVPIVSKDKEARYYEAVINRLHA
jgi:hypothetical protein